MMAAAIQEWMEGNGRPKGKGNTMEQRIGVYLVVKEKMGIALLERDNGQRTVVQHSEARGQVTSIMPTDSPPNGTWFARATTAGVDYVASWYSRSYANRMWKQFVTEQEEYGEVW